MKKQVFTIEIDSSDYAEPISVTYLMAMLRMGFNEANMSDLSILSIEENNVEQNVERPISEESGEKPLALSGNLAWENRNESKEGE